MLRLCSSLIFSKPFYLHSHLIHFFTHVKDNHDKSDNLTKSTQQVCSTAVLGGVWFG